LFSAVKLRFFSIPHKENRENQSLGYSTYNLFTPDIYTFDNSYPKRNPRKGIMNHSLLNNNFILYIYNIKIPASKKSEIQMSGVIT